MSRPVKLIESVFDKEDYASLLELFTNPKQFEYQKDFSRYVVSDSGHPDFKSKFDDLIPLARAVFKSKKYWYF
jgi:hypothetical protein